METYREIKETIDTVKIASKILSAFSGPQSSSQSETINIFLKQDHQRLLQSRIFLFQRLHLWNIECFSGKMAKKR